MDFIQGDKFVKIADYTYAPEIKSAGAYDGLGNTLDINKIKNDDIIYTHTFYVKQLFEVIKNLNKGITVITHNSDTNVDFPPPDNVFKWFTQNVNINHPKIESIPIGLENDRWFPHLKKKEKMIDKLQQPKEYKNLVYMNHNIDNNPPKRLKPYRLLENQSWVTSVHGVNGVGFDEYLENIYNHKFVICPDGNGIDTHRLWECLYMGSIPIVKRSRNSFFYMMLPICQVGDWEEVTEDFLNTTLADFQEKKRNMVWNMKQLEFEYWKYRIQSYKMT